MYPGTSSGGNASQMVRGSEPQVTGFDACEQVLNNLSEEVGKLHSRLTDFANRVGGGTPEKDHPPGGPKPMANGRIHQLRSMIEEVGASVYSCHQIMDRIQRIG